MCVFHPLTPFHDTDRAKNYLQYTDYLYNDYKHTKVTSMIDIEKSIGFLLAKAYQRAFALFKEEFDRYDLTPQQFGLLAFLWLEDGLSQTELSARSQIDRTTMGGLIDRLVKEGMVERKTHPEDRRAYQVFLTDRGKSLEDELSTVAIQVLGKVTAPLTDQEHATLIRLLTKIRY